MTSNELESFRFTQIVVGHIPVCIDLGPMSILSSISKVMEKVIHDQSITYLKKVKWSHVRIPIRIQTIIFN